MNESSTDTPTHPSTRATDAAPSKPGVAPFSWVRPLGLALVLAILWVLVLARPALGHYR